MKILLYTLFVILVTTSCSNETEKIIATHPGGEKKIVAYYKGDGVNEQLVKKLTYDEAGELILKEDLLKNERLDYLQLHPELKTASGLQDYMQGKWLLDIRREWWRGLNKGKAKVNGSRLTYKHDTYWSYENGEAVIKYLPMYRIMLSDATNKKIADRILSLRIESPSTFSYARDDILVDFSRTDRRSTRDNLKGMVLLAIDFVVFLLLINTPRYANSLDDFFGNAMRGVGMLLCVIFAFGIVKTYF